MSADLQRVEAMLAARNLYRDARNHEARDQAAVRLYHAVDELDKAGVLGVLSLALALADALEPEGVRPV